MKSMWRPLGGVALAAVLVLTAVPAQALDAVNDVTSAENASADANGNVAQPMDADAAENAEAETQASGTGDPAAEAAGTDAELDSQADATAESDVQAGTGDGAVVEPSDEAEGSSPAPDESESPEASDLGESFSEVPATVAVNGTLLFAPNEHGLGVLEGTLGETHEEDHGDEEGSWSVATSVGPILPVDAAALTGDVAPLSAFTGELAVDQATADAASESIAQSGAVSAEQLLAVSADVAVAADTVAPLSGVVLSPSSSISALAAKPHTTDIVFFASPGRSVADADMRNLVTQTGTYWKGQTNGAVSSISASSVKRLSLGKIDACNQDALWTTAAKSFGKTPEQYYSGARHLIVFVDKATSCGYAGLAHVGSMHSGGTVWVNLGSRGTTSITTMLAVVAHEVGHNLGLGHGQVRQCTGSTSDSQTVGRTDAQTGLTVQRPVSPCSDIEYGDTWNIMGVSYSGMTPALSIAQKDALGVLPSGALRTVQATGGRTQTFDVNPVSGTTGVRGLKVRTQSGGTLYVEYRNGRGQDAIPGGISDTAYYNGAVSNVRFGTGVQVVKSYPNATWQGRAYPYKRATVIPFRSGGAQVAAGKGAASLVTWNSNVRVTVVSTTPTLAKVKVEFGPFIDIPYDHKFGTEINWMSSSGLSTGINAGSGLRKYDAKSNVTREAMAAFLYRLNTPSGASAPAGYTPPKKSPFVDVPTNHKFYKEIAWMYTSKLSTGISTPSGRAYAPKSGVTREAMAAFLYRMDKSTYQGASTSQFSDVRRGDKFYKEISWMYQSGLSTGVKQPSGKPQYQPKNNVSREAMAAFIYRYKH